MESRPQTRVRRSYVNFEPSSELVEEQDSDTLLLELSGFTKEQLKVQIDNSGNVKIDGERPIGDNKWSRFHKDFKVSSNCDTNSIRATFEDGILFVTMPKIITIQADDHKQDHNNEHIPKAPQSKEHGGTESKHSPTKHAPPSQGLGNKPAADWLPELEPLVNQTGLRKDKGHEEMDRKTVSERKQGDENGNNFYKLKNNTSTTAKGLLGKSSKQGVALVEKLKYKLGGLISSDSHQPSQSAANMVVGILVVVLVGMSVFYMVKSSGMYGN